MVFQKSKFEPNLNLTLYDLLPFGPFVRSRLTLTNKNTVANIFTCHKNVPFRLALMDGKTFGRSQTICAGLQTDFKLYEIQNFWKSPIKTIQVGQNLYFKVLKNGCNFGLDRHRTNQ